MKAVTVTTVTGRSLAPDLARGVMVRPLRVTPGRLAARSAVRGWCRSTSMRGGCGTGPALWWRCEYTPYMRPYGMGFCGRERVLRTATAAADS